MSENVYVRSSLMHCRIGDRMFWGRKI